MAQIKKKFIAANAVDESKIRLSNAGSLKARNAADSGDISILSVDASDRIVFASVPQVASDASANNDLVRYSQIVSLIEGIKPKAAVRAATLVAGTLADDFANGDEIDGVTLATGDRILIKDQADAAENGIYVVKASGAPDRAADFNAVSEIPGSYTAIREGSQEGMLAVCLSAPATLEVDDIEFVLRSITTYTGGDMITVSAGVISVDLAAASGLESSNPGDPSGELQIKLEAANPTLQIDGSNQLGAKLDAAGAIITGAGGLKVQADASTAKINASNQVQALAPKEERITLDGDDITNQYVDLANVAFGSSASENSVRLAVVDGLEQLKAVDYTVSLTGGAGGKTRVSFAGDLATGGDAALEAGDILIIGYSVL